MRRNTFLDIMKVVCAFAILSYHSTYLTTPKSTPIIFKSGYIAVEFFFLLTGYFMIMHVDKLSICKNLGKECISFIMSKIMIILPYYIFAWLISLILIHIPHNFSFFSICTTIIKSLYPTLFLDMAGLGGFAIVGSTWYISAMLIALSILYPLLRLNVDFFSYCAFFIAVLFYGFLYQNSGSVGNPVKYTGICYIGVIRAIAGISLGVCCYNISKKLSFLSLTNLSRWILSLCEIVLYVIAIWMMQKHGLHQKDFLVVFCFFLVIIISTSNQSYISASINKSINYKFFGNMSLALYLCHGRFPGFLNRILPFDLSIEYKYSLYIVLVILTSFLCINICNKSCVYWQNIKRLFVFK